MNKTEFIEKIAEKNGVSKKDAAAAVAMVIDGLTDVMSNKDSVAFVGFGTFGAKERGERTAKNPRTGETVKVPATTVPYFKAGKGLKDAVAK